MRKVIFSVYATLDGVMDDPGGHSIFKDQNWHFPFWDGEDTTKYMMEELMEADALLMGRKTYEEFAPVWPHVTDQTGMANRMNSLPKYVASTTPSQLEWNNSRLIKGDVAEAVKKLKSEDGQAILIFGSCQLVQALDQHDLIDEYRIMLHPIVVGSGTPFFNVLKKWRKLKVTQTRTFEQGVVLLCYQPL
jgi:dihydrofolate reductase